MAINTNITVRGAILRILFFMKLEYCISFLPASEIIQKRKPDKTKKRLTPDEPHLIHREARSLTLFIDP
jgi:hypothetical protein